MSSRITRSMSSSAERASAQDKAKITARGKLRGGGRRPIKGGKTATAAATAATGQFAPVREGDLNAAAGQLAFGGTGDTAVVAGQPVLVRGGETAGDGILLDGGRGAPGEISTIAGPQDVRMFLVFSENIFHEGLLFETDSTSAGLTIRCQASIGVIEPQKPLPCGVPAAVRHYFGSSPSFSLWWQSSSPFSPRYPSRGTNPPRRHHPLPNLGMNSSASSIRRRYSRDE